MRSTNGHVQLHLGAHLVPMVDDPSAATLLPTLQTGGVVAFSDAAPPTSSRKAVVWMWRPNAPAAILEEEEVRAASAVGTVLSSVAV